MQDYMTHSVSLALCTDRALSREVERMVADVRELVASEPEELREESALIALADALQDLCMDAAEAGVQGLETSGPEWLAHTMLSAAWQIIDYRELAKELWIREGAE